MQKPNVMQLPTITTRQQDILKLLYTYRFLDRKQIQALLGHKNKKHAIVWLKDLREKQYVEWIYSTDNLAEKTKPAVYYIGINGVRWLKSTGEHPASELRKRYTENKRSEGFVRHAMFIADICIDLQHRNDPGVSYTWQTRAMYAAPASEYHFLHAEEAVYPDLCLTKQARGTTKTYLLEYLDSTLPRYRVRYRLKQYVEYIRLGDWERATGDAASPTVLFIVPTVAELLYAKRRTRKLLEPIADGEHIVIKFATLAEVKEQGVMAEIWEEA